MNSVTSWFIVEIFKNQLTSPLQSGPLVDEHCRYFPLLIQFLIITSYSSIDNRSSHRVSAPINSTHSSNNTSNYRAINKQSSFSKPFHPVSNKTANSALTNQPGKPDFSSVPGSQMRENMKQRQCVA